MEGTGRAESETEAESNVWSSCRERSETQQTPQPAPPLLPGKVMGCTPLNLSYRADFFGQTVSSIFHTAYLF